MKALSLYCKTAAVASLSSFLIVLPVVGCAPATQASVTSTLASIEGDITLAEGIVATVGPLVAPIDPVVIGPLVADIQSGLPLANTAIGAYLASPSSDGLAKIQASLNSIITNGASALLAASHISNPTSQKEALAALGGLQTILTLIDAKIQTTESASVLKANAAARSTKLAMIDPYLDHQKLDQLARANGTSYQAFYLVEQYYGY